MTKYISFETDNDLVDDEGLDNLVDEEDLLYNDEDENIKRVYTEFRLVSLLVNRIILDSNKDHKRTNHKNICRMRQHKKIRRYQKKGPEKFTNDGELIPYPQVG